MVLLTMTGIWAQQQVKIHTTMGDIVVKLYDETPIHRDNFLKLVREGYYDGTLMHRVIRGFMIQGGDPNSKGAAPDKMLGGGSPDYTLEAEIREGLYHKRGALAAARKDDNINPERRSSGSQFYIVQDPVTCAQLDGAYTVFGETIEGLDVIDKIAKVDTDPRDCPISPVKIVKIELVK
jgi:peptidyl-prolyl cis-trans isomerase B (cyclophilin B)